jgi:hypothetical protein
MLLLSDGKDDLRTFPQGSFDKEMIKEIDEGRFEL